MGERRTRSRESDERRDQWGSFLPGNLGLYSYSLNNPVILRDPDGHNWFKVNGSYEWQPGNTFRGVKSNYTHFLEFTKSGVNEYGAATGTLRLYKQNEVIAESSVFSGGNGSNSIPDGTYTARPDRRGAADSSRAFDQDGNLLPFNGYQEIADASKLIIQSPQREWGTARLRLNPDRGQNGEAFQGNYVHGKERKGDYTHGCICDRQPNSAMGLPPMNGKVITKISGLRNVKTLPVEVKTR